MMVFYEDPPKFSLPPNISHETHDFFFFCFECACAHVYIYMYVYTDCGRALMRSQWREKVHPVSLMTPEKNNMKRHEYAASILEDKKMNKYREKGRKKKKF